MKHSFIHTKKLLLVDDEPELVKMALAILKDEGFEHLAEAGSLKEASKQMEVFRPDLVILDVMLPDGDGFSFMKSIREHSKVPVIFLTARDEPRDRISGLGLGADDYIAKPFLPQEFVLRVHAVLRRCYQEEDPLLYLAGSTIDFSRAEVCKDGQTLFLTAMEHRLLKTLAANEGRIVTMDTLCEALWGDNPFGCENSLNAHVRRIREKIEQDPSRPVSLLTFKGLGYKLVALR